MNLTDEKIVRAFLGDDQRSSYPEATWNPDVPRSEMLRDASVGNAVSVSRTRGGRRCSMKSLRTPIITTATHFAQTGLR
jgi:hypothetical protein